MAHGFVRAVLPGDRLSLVSLAPAVVLLSRLWWVDLDEAPKPLDELQGSRAVPVGETATDRGFRLRVQVVRQGVVANDVGVLLAGLRDEGTQSSRTEVHPVAGAKMQVSHCRDISRDFPRTGSPTLSSSCRPTSSVEWGAGS
ncbi:hypothetical protein, partial [Micromonospora sp. 15K316]|uniref:hypothetical protein n=1 Tax=Micromonospora sp. 15K316 TaxID=2530376 RepID=UPI001A9D1183